MKAQFVLFPALALAAACQSAHTSVQTVAPASVDQRAALIDRVKALDGSWEATMGGKTMVASEFKVSSNGSAVREVMFPGAEHEMTNMYTMDGETLVMTHYCAEGNQPRMRARAGSAGDPIRLESDGVGNLNHVDSTYMGGLTLTIRDSDHMRAEWVHYKSGQPFGDNTVIELTRKK